MLIDVLWLVTGSPGKRQVCVGGMGVRGVKGYACIDMDYGYGQQDRKGSLNTRIGAIASFVFLSYDEQRLPTSVFHNYHPRLSQSHSSFPSLALFQNNGPKFHFSQRSLWDAFTVLTSVCTARSVEMPALWSFNCSPHPVLINPLTHRLPWGGEYSGETPWVLLF